MNLLLYLSKMMINILVKNNFKLITRKYQNNIEVGYNNNNDEFVILFSIGDENE